jgi:hypothetical protein
MGLFPADGVAVFDEADEEASSQRVAERGPEREVKIVRHHVVSSDALASDENLTPLVRFLNPPNRAAGRKFPLLARGIVIVSGQNTRHTGFENDSRRGADDVRSLIQKRDVEYNFASRQSRLLRQG